MSFCFSFPLVAGSIPYAVSSHTEPASASCCVSQHDKCNLSIPLFIIHVKRQSGLLLGENNGDELYGGDCYLACSGTRRRLEPLKGLGGMNGSHSYTKTNERCTNHSMGPKRERKRSHVWIHSLLGCVLLCQLTATGLISVYSTRLPRGKPLSRLPGKA